MSGVTGGLRKAGAFDGRGEKASLDDVYVGQQLIYLLFTKKKILRWISG